MGFHHIDLGTADMEATRKFYEDVVGFKLVRADLIEVRDAGNIMHYFFDCGDGNLLAFMSCENVHGFPDVQADICRGLKVPHGVYHFAFRADSEDELHAIKKRLETNGAKVTPVQDIDGWAKSIFFDDPNGNMMEFCYGYGVNDFTKADTVPTVRKSTTLEEMGYA